jgi:PadR family transcriptional regulator, regulatory protein AphA
LASASPATFALLGLLASRSWTGYELTRQVQRSLRFAWPTSESHLYREQARLVDLGWATVEDEPVGDRTRKRYAITTGGRQALRSWLSTPPQAPQFHVEGILRAFYADRGEVSDLVASMQATAQMSRALRTELLGFVAEYLEDGGPMTMLEQGIGRQDERLEFHGRPMFPERLPVVALAIDVMVQLLGAIDEFCDTAAAEVTEWPSMTHTSLAQPTRQRLERIAATGT